MESSVLNSDLLYDGQQQQQQQQQHTVITNPGISDRIEKDVVGFHQYGFSFERCKSPNDLDRNVSAASRGRGTLHSRQVSSSANATDVSTAITSAPNSNNPPYHLRVDVPNASLVPTVGPFLRTLVRISDGLDPRALVVVVYFHWTEQAKCQSTVSGVDFDVSSASMTVSRTMAHHVHMIVRNSMGAALFLTNLSIVLPDGVRVEDVQEAMAGNEDVNYPTVRLIARRGVEDLLGLYIPAPPRSGVSSGDSSGEGRSVRPICVNECFDPTYDGRSATIVVRTRMCTVRATPVLYRLARTLRGKRTDPSSDPPQPDQRTRPPPYLLACVDKVANLYRIIMLAGDYGATHRLLLVVRNAAVRAKLAAATTKFLAGLGGTDVDGGGGGSPRVETIDDARTFLEEKCDGCVVAVDLHPDAATLDDEDEEDGDGTGRASTLLGNCGALIWGFEKDGVPGKLDELCSGGGGYVQIRCRSSLNLVAAMSVVMHAYEPAAQVVTTR